MIVSLDFFRHNEINRQGLVLISSCFSPLTPSHHRYIDWARSLGDNLVIVVNNDISTAKLKFYNFRNQNERLHLVDNMNLMGYTLLSESTEQDISYEIGIIKPDIFAKRTEQEIPDKEKEVCSKLGCRILFNVGGTYVSELLNNLNKFDYW